MPIEFLGWKKKDDKREERDRRRALSMSRSYIEACLPSNFKLKSLGLAYENSIISVP